MNFSTDSFTLAVNHPVSDVEALLRNNTLIKNKLYMEITKKRFIGTVSPEGFSLIGAVSTQDVVCCLNGRFSAVENNTTQIEIQTKIHKALMILFIVFSAGFSLFLVFTFITTPNIYSYFQPVFMLLLAITVFRLFLHIKYKKARNRAIKNLELLLS